MSARPGADAPEQQVGIAPRADQRERAQETIGAEVLTGGQELAFVLLTLGGGSRRHAGSTFRNVNFTKLRGTP